MAQTKIEKIASIEEEIRQLENKRRELLQEQKTQERKDRTKRLCRRMGLFESLLPDSIPLTEDLFKTFLEKTITTDQSRRILGELTAQNAANAAPQGAETAAQIIPLPPLKPHIRRERAAQTRARATAQGRAANALSLALARAHLYTT